MSDLNRKITQLKTQARDKERVNVYIDGKFAFGVALAVALELSVGQELSPESIAALKDRDHFEKTKQRALNYLSYRPRSVAEVRRQLLAKEIDPETVESTIAHLRETQTLDDEAFARYWIEQRDAFKPRSGYALSQELRQKGVEQQVIDRVLQEHDDQAAAVSAARKRARRWADLPFDEFRLKIGRFLQGRGFSYSISQEAIDQVWAENQPTD
jgi:regulatory protein